MPDEILNQPEVTSPQDAPEQPSQPAATPNDGDAFMKGVESVKADEPATEPDAALAAEAAKVAAEKQLADKPQEPPKNDTDAEIAKLGLKEETAKRFRELTDERGQFKDRAEKAEARAQEWESMVMQTGASPDQYSSALGYLQAINSGDPQRMGQAFDAMLQELTWLGKKCGREVPGAFDPLADHADLRNAVEVGEISRAQALELARYRAQSAQHNEWTQRQQQQTAQQSAMSQAQADIARLNDRLKADPAFAQKLDMLAPTLDVIRSSLPPQQWAQAIERAWSQLPAIQPAQPKPAVSAMPLRPTGAAAAMQRKPKSDMEAFELGVASVR